MKGQLSIQHENIACDDLYAKLEERFGANDPASLSRSPLLQAPFWRDKILYTRELSTYRMACLADQTNQTQLIVEPLNGQIQSACQAAWDGLRSLVGAANLRSAQISDNTSDYVVLAGASGFLTQISELEVIVPVLVAIATIVVMVVGIVTYVGDHRYEFLSGGVAPVLGGLALLVAAVLRSYKGKIVWHE